MNCREKMSDSLINVAMQFPNTILSKKIIESALKRGKIEKKDIEELLKDEKSKIKFLVDSIVLTGITPDKKLFFSTIVDPDISLDSKRMVKDLFSGTIEFTDIEHFLHEPDISKKTKIILAREIEKSAENIKKLQEIGLDPHNFLFECDSDGGDIFDELLKNIIENESDLYSELQKIATSFIETHSLETNKYSPSKTKILKDFFTKNNIGNTQDALNLGIDTDKISLSIYARYGWKISHPEIAELIIIFLDTLQKKQAFRYFSDLRILPRFHNKYKPKKLLEQIDAKYLPTTKMDFFTVLNYNACSMYLSHSHGPGRKEIPSIISDGIITTENTIPLGLELENHDDYHSKIKNRKQENMHISTEEVLTKVQSSLEQLEAILDKKYLSETIKLRETFAKK